MNWTVYRWLLPSFGVVNERMVGVPFWSANPALAVAACFSQPSCHVAAVADDAPMTSLAAAVPVTVTPEIGPAGVGPFGKNPMSHQIFGEQPRGETVSSALDQHTRVP